MSAAHMPLALPAAPALPEADLAEPVRRGLAAHFEVLAERDRLKDRVAVLETTLAQEQARSAGLEHDLRRAEIHRDEARIERDAAVREAAKYETFFEAQQSMMREFSPKPAADRLPVAPALRLEAAE